MAPAPPPLHRRACAMLSWFATSSPRSFFNIELGGKTSTNDFFDACAEVYHEAVASQQGTSGHGMCNGARISDHAPQWSMRLQTTRSGGCERSSTRWTRSRSARSAIWSGYCWPATPFPVRCAWTDLGLHTPNGRSGRRAVRVSAREISAGGVQVRPVCGRDEEPDCLRHYLQACNSAAQFSIGRSTPAGAVDCDLTPLCARPNEVSRLQVRGCSVRARLRPGSSSSSSSTTATFTRATWSAALRVDVCGLTATQGQRTVFINGTALEPLQRCRCVRAPRR